MKSRRSSATLDRLALRADHLDAALFQHSRVIERDRKIERRLATDSRQQGIGSFSPNDCGDGFDGQRFDVGDVSGFRISHDRGWIRIDQHDLVAFLAQRLASLRAGVVKLARLSDDDWTRADD